MTRLLALLITVLALTAGCGDDTGSADDPGPQDSDTGSAQLDLTGNWILTQGTASDTPLELDATHPITLTVEGDQVSGQSACNRYMGQVTVSGDSVSFGALGGTQMACVPESVMALEQTYLAAMGTVDSGSLSGDTLTLTGPGTSLTFETVPPVEPASLTGTTWVLESVIADDAVSTTLGKPAKLVLAEDGTLSGGTGCRQFSGPYELSDDQLSAPALAATMQACPDEVAGQDEQVLAVLTGPARVSINGSSLTLVLADGRGLGYRAR